MYRNLTSASINENHVAGKWRTIALLSLAEFLGMSLWFSASAVTPALLKEWHLTTGQSSYLTMAVQLGFVIGAFLSALFNLADILPPRLVFAGGCFMGAAANFLIPMTAHGLTEAVVLRFITGASLAAVYPVGMKIMTTWMKKDRGLGLGLLVGALTLGSASPHLIKSFGGVRDWQSVMYLVSLLAFAGGILGLAAGRQGPFRTPSPPFRWRYIGEAFSREALRMANFGYLGHMWELYAMWTWIPLFLLESYRRGVSPAHLSSAGKSAALASFVVIGIGGVGSLIAGYLADRWGRSRTTIFSLLISGGCALMIGFFFRDPFWATVIAVLWGFAVVADSAQFSTAVSEICHPQYVGTALTIQTSAGFLLTLASIRLIPFMVKLVGWRWSFVALAIGPVLGILAMAKLRRLPEAAQMAGGRG